MKTSDNDFGYAEFDKRRLPAIEAKICPPEHGGKRCQHCEGCPRCCRCPYVRRGTFGSLYWFAPDRPEPVPWDKEIAFAISKWGLGLRDFEYAKVQMPKSRIFDDIAQDLRTELASHEARGDDVPHFSPHSPGGLNPNVVQVCKHRLLNIWKTFTIESGDKIHLPFAAKHRVRNTENKVVSDQNGEESIPKYLQLDVLESLDGMAQFGGDICTGDENDEASTQHRAEGYQEDGSTIANMSADTTTRNHSEDALHEALSAGESQDLMRLALATLKPEEQLCIKMFYGLDDFGTQTRRIGKQLGIKESSVNKTVSRAVVKLRSRMDRMLRANQGAQVRPSLPAKHWDAYREETVRLWQSLRITKASYYAQLVLRAKYPDVAGSLQDGSWVEPRTTILNLDQRTQGNDGDERFFARRQTRPDGVAYRSMTLTATTLSWRECSNPECPYNVVIVGRRLRIGTRKLAKGVQCPLCRLLQRQTNKSIHRVKCALCATQDRLNSLCSGCFDAEFPEERRRRRASFELHSAGVKV